MHITEVLGEDRFEEVHLCEECAKKYLYEPQQKKKAAKVGAVGRGRVGRRCPGRNAAARRAG